MPPTESLLLLVVPWRFRGPFWRANVLAAKSTAERRILVTPSLAVRAYSICSPSSRVWPLNLLSFSRRSARSAIICCELVYLLVCDLKTLNQAVAPAVVDDDGRRSTPPDTTTRLQVQCLSQNTSPLFRRLAGLLVSYRPLGSKRYASAEEGKQGIENYS